MYTAPNLKHSIFTINQRFYKKNKKKRLFWRLNYKILNKIELIIYLVEQKHVSIP